MIRSFVEEACALVALGLFVATVLVWAGLLSFTSIAWKVVP